MTWGGKPRSTKQVLNKTGIATEKGKDEMTKENYFRGMAWRNRDKSTLNEII